MAIVKSRPGAMAQARQAGVSPSFLNIALLKSDAMKRAAERTYGRQIEQGRQGMSLSQMIFDKKLDQQKQLANKQLSLQRHMFDRNMDMQNQRFEANRPSDLEMAIGTVLPYATNAYASYKDSQAQKEYEARMQGLFAEQGINYKADLLDQQLKNNEAPNMSVPAQMLQQTPSRQQMRYGNPLPPNSGQMQFRGSSVLNTPLPQQVGGVPNDNQFDPRFRARFGGYQ